MRLLERYRRIPPSVSGHRRRDPTLGVADALVSALFAATAATRRIPVPSGAGATLPLRVTQRRVVALDQDVIELTLAAAGGGALPRWYPGAHLDVHLPSGRVRQYSLCGDPAATDAYRIAVRRIPGGGGGSVEIHDDVAAGAVVHTHGPRNAFPLTVPGRGSPARRFRFIAGGIGITPILPMLRLAEQVGVEWSMIYTGRSRDSLPFLDEVAGYGAAVEVRTDDEHGLPTAAHLLGDCPGATSVYACGPAPMLTAIRAALVGRDDVELHFERFAAPPVVDGRSFPVTVASSGQSIAVGADETLLAALGRAGVHAPYSCRQGFCGTCRTRVLAGDVDHRDALLTDPERAAGMMLTCVSRAAGDTGLTLDL
ncbi:flavodoxin reductase family protein [Mycolicibacterium chubuense NBB4]|uniref:Flavodoxin reductase family protein n=1 Tax=Mycolicibacterium chubuense (strain NBB4) TaxID=710421 RepID=I4BJN4_MYCCN|nr:PDR/VanB family oxidoreductase [Mycolicibacterium chubuense]AFM17491.1 flavodoxin reductase family protein [Mycolicibacterium chubuense NBB4]